MTLEELFEATANGQLKQLFDARSAEITPALAEEARTVFKEAVGAGNAGLAQMAALAAASLWLRLGNREDALVNFIDAHQVGYMSANTPAEYAQVRTQLLEARAMADEIGARNQGFKAATIAADCSFWAAEASDQKGRDDLVLQTLADLVAASDVAEADGSADFERYVSLTAAAARVAMSTLWFDEDEARATDLLRQLAAASDRTIPADFTYSQFGDPAKTADTAEGLALLADRYGA